MSNPAAPEMLNSIVFLGDQFTTSIFDERTLFEDIGQIDRDQLKNGPLGHFTYENGRYQLQVTPPRIDIKSHGPVILPDELTKVAYRVAEVLKPLLKVIPVTAVGINCDAVFELDMIGQSGAEFCGQLAINPLSRKLIQYEPFFAATRFSFEDQQIRYTIKIEPHQDAKGKNLFVAVNGHQVFTEQDDLYNKLDAVQHVRTYIAGLHQRIGDWEK